MRLLYTTVFLIILMTSPVFAVEHLRLATTTSTENSGLLDELIPPFEQQTGSKVDVIAVGTGKAIKLGENGDVDVILVHARSREDRFVAAGYGIDRRNVMYNDFILLGPAEDPAGLSRTTRAAQALAKIAASKSTFVSRGDDSGTHTREMQLWQEAAVTPEGGWYLEAGRGMGDVIIMATERRGYTLSDRGTYLALRGKTDLQVLVDGGKHMFNPYGAIMVNPAKHPHIKAVLAEKFLDYLTSAEARKLISDFRVNSEQLFYVLD